MSKQFLKQLNKKRLAVLLVVALLAALTGFSWWSSYRQEYTLRIQGTGRKEDISYGTDIRIQSILLNGRPLTAEDVTLGGTWDEAGDYFISLQATPEIWLDIPYRATDDLRITFQMQHGSGYVQILRDGELLQERNLYAQAYTTEEYRDDLISQKSTLQKSVPFLLLGEVLILEYLVLSLLLQFFDSKKKLPALLRPLLLLAGAVMLHLCTELISGNLASVSPLCALENILLYAAVMLVLFLFSGSAGASIAGVSLVWTLFTLANHYVLLLRGSPITPGDFYTLKTAANVAGNYDYTLPAGFCWAMGIFVLFAAVTEFLERNTERLVFKKRTFLCIPVAVLVFLITCTGMYQKKMNLWNLETNLKNYGMGVNMVSSIRNMHLDKPAGYSKEQAEEILGSYREEPTDFNPNIVVIMNESFSDLSVLWEGLDSDAYLPNYNALAENTVKGTAVSSVIGGLTANAEYEFLTGNSIYFMKDHVPYQQHINGDTYSLVRVLKDRGYGAVAVHPYDAVGYNRPRVYPNLGFDDFITVEDFSPTEMTRNMYISDRDSYAKVIETYERIREEGKPAFIFNVTMQNHSHYHSGFYGENVISLPGAEGQFPEAEEYVTLIRESDEDILYLLDYFSHTEDPTVVLLFGDHQPHFDTSFYEAAYGKPSGEFTAQDRIRSYEVPFFIWANYDIQEAQGLYTSLNYLSALLFDRTGISPTPYQNYLLELYDTIPSISRNWYVDSNGTVYSYHDQNPELAQRLEQYWYVQYYHIFEKDVTH